MPSVRLRALGPAGIAGLLPLLLVSPTLAAEPPPFGCFEAKMPGVKRSWQKPPEVRALRMKIGQDGEDKPTLTPVKILVTLWGDRTEFEYSARMVCARGDGRWSCAGEPDRHALTRAEDGGLVFSPGRMSIRTLVNSKWIEPLVPAGGRMANLRLDKVNDAMCDDLF